MAGLIYVFEVSIPGVHVGGGGGSVLSCHRRGSLYQIFNSGPSFYFMVENGKLHVIFSYQYCLHCIKRGHI